MEKAKNNALQAGKKERNTTTSKQSQSTPPVKPRKFVLTKVSHVRAELGKLYSEARNKQIDVSDASKLANMLGILHRIIADSDLEERIAEIEKQLEGGRS